MDLNKFNFKIISNDRKKRRNVFRWLKKNDVDICFVQETSTHAAENVWKNELGGKMLFSHGTNHARGWQFWSNRDWM